MARAGDTIVMRQGHYELTRPIHVENAGRADAWISFVAYPGEQPVFDGINVLRAFIQEGQSPLDNGLFQIERVSYVRVIGLAIINSHDAGFTIRDSSDVDLINNSTSETFSSGIAVWDTAHSDHVTNHIRILGNTVTGATRASAALSEGLASKDGPHEAISIGGAHNFEVAYNHVSDSDKEGIDVKETSSEGVVHHNVVHNLPRQGLYVDAWFGLLRNVQFNSNVVHDCKGAGIVVSVEQGKEVADVKIDGNLIFDNAGSGIYFSGWGANNLRQNIEVSNNTVVHNGYGEPEPGREYYWLTGGLYLYSTNIRNVKIAHNTFRDNRGFQIGYSDLFLEKFPSWIAAEKRLQIDIADNLISGANAEGAAISSEYPPPGVKIHATNGTGAILKTADLPNAGQINVLSGAQFGRGVSPGPFAEGTKESWWRNKFPPALAAVSLH